MLLMKFDEPGCPRCGCQDTELQGRPQQSYATFESRRCLACGKSFYAEVAKPEPEDAEVGLP